MQYHRNARGRFTKSWRQATVGDMILFGSMLLGFGITLVTAEVRDSIPVEEHLEQIVVEPVREEVRIEVMYDWDRERIREEVWRAATKYNTFPEKMWEVMLCENPQLTPNLQSLVVRDGVREDSWGLAQFWLPAKNRTADGRVITKEIATDPVEAIDAMAYHFSKGNAKLWSCYRTIYNDNLYGVR